MQELITSIGSQKIRIVADENGIKVEEYVERIIDEDLIHSKTPIPVGVDKNGNDVYIGIARAKYGDQLPREPMLFLCDEHGRKLSACTLLLLGEDGTVNRFTAVQEGNDIFFVDRNYGIHSLTSVAEYGDICSGVRTDYAPVGWRFSSLGDLPVKG